jgi:hypothetical protein
VRIGGWRLFVELHRLSRVFGPRLRGVVLYGSSARGDRAADSDIDLLALLAKPVVLGRAARVGGSGLRGVISVTAFIPALFFALAGLAKLQDPLMAAVFVSRALSVHFILAVQITCVAAALEVIVAVSPCLFLTRSVLPAVVGLCVLGFFLGLLVRLAAFYPQIATCGCFGSLMGATLRRSPGIQIAIDAGLACLLAAHIVLVHACRSQAGAPGLGEAPDGPESAGLVASAIHPPHAPCEPH